MTNAASIPPSTQQPPLSDLAAPTVPSLIRAAKGSQQSLAQYSVIADALPHPLVAQALRDAVFLQLLFDPNSNFDELIPVDDFFSDYISQLEAAGGDTPQQQAAAAVQEQSGVLSACRLTVISWVSHSARDLLSSTSMQHTLCT
jgi:hypothetical protein